MPSNARSSASKRRKHNPLLPNTSTANSHVQTALKRQQAAEDRKRREQEQKEKEVEEEWQRTIQKPYKSSKFIVDVIMNDLFGGEGCGKGTGKGKEREVYGKPGRKFEIDRETRARYLEKASQVWRELSLKDHYITFRPDWHVAMIRNVFEKLPTPFYHHPYTLEALLEIALDPQTVQVVAFVFINIFDDTMNPTVKKIRAAGGDEGVLTERQRRKMKEGEWKAMLTLKCLRQALASLQDPTSREGRNYLKYLRLKVIPEITSMLVDSSSYFIADGIVAGICQLMREMEETEPGALAMHALEEVDVDLSTVGKHLASSRSLESLDSIGGLLATFINRSRAKREAEIREVLFEMEPAWSKHDARDRRMHRNYQQSLDFRPPLLYSVFRFKSLPAGAVLTAAEQEIMSHIKTTGLLLVGKEDIAVLDLAPMASFEGEEMEVVMRFGREEVDGMRLVDDHDLKTASFRFNTTDGEMNIDLLEHGERYDFYATMQSLGYDVMIVSARSRTALGYQEVVKGEDEIRTFLTSKPANDFTLPAPGQSKRKRAVQFEDDSNGSAGEGSEPEERPPPMKKRLVRIEEHEDELAEDNVDMPVLPQSEGSASSSTSFASPIQTRQLD